MNGYVWYSPLKDFRASNRKLSCVGFEATIIKLCLDALTNWAIRPDFQIAVRTNFAQLLQIFIFCSVFILVIFFVYLNGSSERPFIRFNQLSYYSMSSPHTQTQICTAVTSVSSFVLCSDTIFHYCLYYMWLLL